MPEIQVQARLLENGINNLLDVVKMSQYLNQKAFYPKKNLIRKEKRNKICINSCIIALCVKYLNIVVLM
jgi:hypothetical protein